MIDARNPTGTRASRRAVAVSDRSTGGVVDDRVGVRHRDHRAEAAGGRRRGAARDVLLVLLAGGPQVDVRVDERGKRVLAVRVEHLGPVRHGRPAGGRELGDLAVADHDVAPLVEAGARVEHVRVADHELGRVIGCVVEAFGHRYAAT